MPSRLGEYERLIETALSNGYTHTSVIDFYDALRDGRVASGQKFFVRRHDVDTDVATAKAMFNIEKRLGVKSSFYFRLSTWDTTLMREMHESGFEVSYHYEELATVAKQKKLKSKEEIEKSMPEIRARFEDNFTRLTNTLQFKMRSVASHGDFVNRKLGVPNHALLTIDMKGKLGIDVECYDDVLLGAYDAIISDTDYPQFFRPTNPFDILQVGDQQVVYLLTHPRQWRINAWVNTKDNLKRLFEGLRYEFS